jgi:predicted nucleic acid-binding protein
MKKIVFDSYAIIALLKEESGYEKVRELFVQISQNKTEGYMTTVNVGEVYYMMARKSNMNFAEEALRVIHQLPIEIVDPDLKLSIEAAKLKSKYSLSYADAYAAALTIQKKATLVSGDKEFDTLLSLKDFKIMYL